MAPTHNTDTDLSNPTCEIYKESNTKKTKHRWHHNHTKEIPTTEKARIIHSKTSNMAAA
jgi:hypothetical protein